MERIQCGRMSGKPLFLLLLARRGGSLGGLSLRHALLEFIDAASGIHELLLPSVERVARVADAYHDRGPTRASLDHITASAADLGLDILWMNVSFHKARAEKVSMRGGMTRGN